MEIDVSVSCEVHDSFRVQQVAGMFDLPPAKRATETFRVELPDHDEQWDIGLIVGPSGSGKSTVAREAFGDRLSEQFDWPDDRAVVDGFGDIGAREVTDLLVAVGFGSPPSWVKPYGALSNGERFRCDLARALSAGVRAEQGAPDRRLRRVHERGRSRCRPRLFRRDREGGPRRPAPLPVCRGVVPLRHRRLARARLGAGHGRRSARTEASSATEDRNRFARVQPCGVAPVCASSLFEWVTRAAGALLPGLLVRQAGRVCGHAAGDHTEGAPALLAARDAPRLPRYRDRHAIDGGRGRSPSIGATQDQHHQ